MKQLNNKIQQQLKVLENTGSIFRSSFTGQQVWDLYLASFKEDPIFRDPQSTEQLRFDILKEVFLDKKATNEAIRTAKEDKEFNQKIENLIEQKQDDKLSSLTVEELLKLKR